MLTIDVPELELYNETENLFWNFEGGQLELEHSLVAVAEWEKKWRIPFLEQNELPLNQIRDYIRCMTLNKVPDDKIYGALTRKNLEDVIAYIKAPMTATWFSTPYSGVANQSKLRGEKITAELIYCWMIMFNIPIEFDKWHLNRLMTLIRVVSIKNAGPKKMSAKQAALERHMLNEQRKAKYKTSG